MKKTKVQRRSNSSLSSRLAAYSATAGAALLAAPTTGTAAIHDLTEFSLNSGPFATTPPSLTVPNLQSGHLDFSARGASHVFQMRFNINNDFAPGAGFASVTARNPALKLFANNGVQKFALGAPLAGPLAATGSLDQHFASGGFGPFVPTGANAAVTGYFGFKELANAKTYYGWMRVKLQNDASGIPVTASMVAVNGDPTVFGAFGQASDDLKAGEFVETPEPGTLAIGGLGLLAMGASGIRELRRRREQAVNN